jgi:hypothetical protein
MLRPLILDISALLIPLCVGAIAFFVGRKQRRWSRALRIGLAILAIGIFCGGVASLVKLWPDRIGFVAHFVGGSTVLLSWLACYLIGIVWASPTRSLSRFFLACILIMAGVAIAVESCGHLLWRSGFSQLWANVPDSNGLLRQTSGVTCGPAAAAMLLHLYGITASEAEIAYLAGTSIFGSDAWQLADALDQRVRSRGWHARADRRTYDQCIGVSPFVADITNRLGGHAILVKSVSPDGAEVVDPGDGVPKRLSRAQLEAVWDGTIVTIVL